MPYKNILLIDDDEDDQEIFITALEKVDLSISCITLDNAREALQLLNTGKINPELIFLDLNMPVMSGQQFLHEIKKDLELSTIPVVILSTSSHVSTIRQVKESGAQDFYSKPDKFEDMINILKSVLT